MGDTYGALKTCMVCKDPILGGTFHKLENNFIHAPCYKCSKCNCVTTPELAQVRKLVITCTPCYGKSYWKRCSKCKEPMKPSDILTVINEQMHHKCYCCSQCKQTMLPGRQYMLEGEVFCSIKCGADFQNAKFKKQQEAKKAASKPPPKVASLVKPTTSATPAPATPATATPAPVTQAPATPPPATSPAPAEAQPAPETPPAEASPTPAPPEQTQ